MGKRFILWFNAMAKKGAKIAAIKGQEKKDLRTKWLQDEYAAYEDRIGAAGAEHL